MTKTSTAAEPEQHPCSSNDVRSADSPFKRPPSVSPRGGGIKKRLGGAVGGNSPVANGNGTHGQQQQHRHFGRGRAAYQQNQNRFRYANAVCNNNNNNNYCNNNRQQHQQNGVQQQPRVAGDTLFLPPSRIRYTQASIKSTFNDGRSLVDTYKQLSTRQIKKRDIPMIEVVQKDDKWWTLNNRRLAVFSELERRQKCKVIRVRVRPSTEAITELLLRNTTTSSGEICKIRVLKDEAEKCPVDQLELFEDLLDSAQPEDNRKPEGWSRERWERERTEKEILERERRNPKPGMPDGWGQNSRTLPTMAASEQRQTLAVGDDVMFDQRDLDFDLDFLPDFDVTSPRDSGRFSGSSSTLSSQGGNSASTNASGAEQVFDMEDDIDFDREDIYLDGCPALERIEDPEGGVAAIAGEQAARAPSPTPSESMTNNFSRNFRLESPRRNFRSASPPQNRRQFVVDRNVPPPTREHRPLRQLPVAQVLNAGKRKRPLAYYFLKKFGMPRAPMSPKPDGDGDDGKTVRFHCGCGHVEEKLSELGRHKDKSGHWAYKGVGFDSLRHLIENEDLRIAPPQAY